MLSKIGVAITCIGVMMADSEHLLAPLITIMIGAALIMTGRTEPKKEREADGQV